MWITLFITSQTLENTERRVWMKKLNTNLIIGLALTLLVSIPVVISFFWLPYDVNEMDYSAVFETPSARHIFGTDNFGRDIFSRTVEGAKSTFMIAAFTVLCGAVIGGIVGAFTGYYGGIVDEILMRVNDCLASFPSILLALVIVSVLDKGTLNICIALGLVFIPSFARIMRAEFLARKGLDYVLNAKLTGAGDLRIMFVHILPNTLPALGSALLVGFNNAVLAEAGLSYLGLGVQPPDPSLGRMLAEAQVYIFGAPWYVIFASLTMVAAILGLTLISDNVGVSAVNFRQLKKKAEERRLAELGAKSENGGETDAGKGDAVSGRTDAVISVDNLHVGFMSESGIREVINGISFDLHRGEILGLVGESGSGKSVTAMSILRITPDTSVVTEGDILLDGVSLPALSEQEMCGVRGRKIAMIFQEPMTSLNPVQTIGEQLDEVLELHGLQLSAGEQRRRVLEALDDTGLENPQKLYNMYPHELSGGMRQRVMIAMAVISGAEVILADEPTTALDADIADVILDIFAGINRKYGTSIILISHDLGIISGICSRALVMKDGEIVEELDINDDGEFARPETEYGKKLLKAAFADNSYVETESGNDAGMPKPESGSEPRLVEIKDLNVYYKSFGKTIFSAKTLKQVNFNVNMTIERGDCVGIVGPSGCGKTTLVKAIAGLQTYTDGQLILNCRRPAMVFQDPISSLNPAMTVGRILEEPLRLSGLRGYKQRSVRQERIKRVLKAVELDESLSTRIVSELSGGQRQRVSIALSILLYRELIILDEPVSALDVTIREQIIELLMRLKRDRDLTFIIISHDRRLVSRICNKVYNMEDGHAVQVY